MPRESFTGFLRHLLYFLGNKNLLQERIGKNTVGKSFKIKDRSWTEYMGREASSEHEDSTMGLVYQPERQSLTATLAALDAPARQDYSPDAEEKPVLRRKKQGGYKEGAVEQVKEDLTVNNLIEDNSIWMERGGFKGADSKNVRAWKHVMLNRMRFIDSSNLKTVSYGGAGCGAQFKPRVAPTRLDFLADSYLCAKRVLSPALFRVFYAFFELSNGEHDELIPKLVFLALAEKVGAEFLRCQLVPVSRYFGTVMLERKAA